MLVNPAVLIPPAISSASLDAPVVVTLIVLSAPSVADPTVVS